MRRSNAVAAGMLICRLSLPAGTPGTPWVQRGSPGSESGGEWTRVQIPDPPTALIVRRALDEASHRLSDPECQRILTGFHDREGRPLADRLAVLGLNVQSYLRVIVFRDGSSHEICGSTLAYTRPASRVVYVCGRAVERHWDENREYVVETMLHEMLHTLGLQEDPPSSTEISRRIRQHCRASRR
jgi:hypothetical protein